VASVAGAFGFVMGLVCSLSVWLVEARLVWTSPGSAGKMLAATVALCALFGALGVAGARVIILRKSAASGDDGESAEQQPTDTSGLDEIGLDEPELKDLLRVSLYATGADEAALYLLGESQVLNRWGSTSKEAAMSAPKWFVEDALRFRHAVTASELSTLGSQRRIAGDVSIKGPSHIMDDGPPFISRVRSAAAAPVVDGSVVLGVLSLSSLEPGAFVQGETFLVELLAAQFARALSRERVGAETERTIEQLMVIQDESAKLVTSLDFMAIIDLVAEAMQRLAPDMEAAVLVRADSGFRVAYNGTDLSGQKHSVELTGTLAAMAVDECEYKYFSSLKGYSVPALPEGVFAGNAAMGSALMLPFVYSDEVRGLAVLVSPEQDAITARAIDSLKVVADQAAISLTNAMFHAETKARALTDGLTGLCNHKHFMTIAADEVRRYGSNLSPLALALVDIDHFKRINDTYGHLSGDAVLRSVSGILQGAFRESDLVARYGGEEFAVLMIGAPAQEALRLAERVRKKIRASVFPVRGGDLKLTVSIGLAFCTMEMKTAAELVERADKALYKAKASGRNRTITAMPIAEA
jgi:diguanylate cyclase (GGDEF)-like protein